MKCYYLGCDVSKGYADFIVLDEKKREVISVFQLDDIPEGHSCLREILIELVSSCSNSRVYAGVESTGGLENNWMRMMLNLRSEIDIHVARLNPSGIKALYTASLTRSINDGVSARMIAEYMIVYPEKVRYNEDDPYYDLRRQWSYIYMLKKQLVQMKNQLHNMLYTNFPFLVSYCKRGLPNWILDLLLKYPTAEKLSRARKGRVARISYITEERAEELVEKAKNNVGYSSESSQLVIKSLVKGIKDIQSLIKEQESYLDRYKDLPQIKLLMSFKGIGIKTAVGILVHIVDIDRFSSSKEIASYFGVHPVYKESGDSKKCYRMSKKGRGSMRHILYMVALCSVRSNPLIKEIYARHLGRGKSKMSALGVCMHKILRIVYGMLKHNREFDPEIDRRNRDRKERLERDEEMDSLIRENNTKKRRYQSYDDSAPISRRESKMRRMHPTT